MQSGTNRELPSTEIVDDQPGIEPGLEVVPGEPLAAWIGPGVTVEENLAMAREHERGVCRCDACRARGAQPPRFR